MSKETTFNQAQFQDEIVDRLASIFNRPPEKEILMSAEEASDFLKISASTLSRYRKEGAFNRYYVNGEGYPKYKFSELISCLKTEKH